MTPGFGCDTSAHCIVGNKMQGRLAGSILGISFESVYIWELLAYCRVCLCLHRAYYYYMTFCPNQLFCLY